MSQRCPVCNCEEASALCLARDRFQPSGEIYRLARCRACAFTYLLDGSDAKRPEELYPAAYFASPKAYTGRSGPRPELVRIEKLSSKLRSALERLYFSAIYSYRLLKVRRIRPTAKTILDLGSGGGEFVKLCVRAGFEAWGVDLRSSLDTGVSQGDRAKIFHGDFQQCDLPINYFDIITMYHSLEHFHRPLDVLKKINKLLKSGGLLLVLVPNIDSLQFRLFRGRWFAIEAPRHRVHFSPVTLRDALEKEGFQIEKLSHFCLRDSSASLASSFCPSKAPMTLKGMAKSELIAWMVDLAYAFLLCPAYIFALFEALLGKGGSIVAIAKKCR